MLRILLIFLAFLPGAAWASPWIVTGQTAIPRKTAVFNPEPSDPGAVGQVLSLPYEVPIGCQLTIQAMGVEAYRQDEVTVLFLWTGPDSILKEERNAVATATVSANDGSNEITGQRLVFPAGTILNVTLINGSNSHNNWTYGWYVSGDLAC